MKEKLIVFFVKVWGWALYAIWPAVVPFRTLRFDFKLGLTYAAGFLFGFLFASLVPFWAHTLVFITLLVTIGIFWGQPIARHGMLQDKRLNYLTTFIAGMLLAYPVHSFTAIVGFVLSKFRIGIIL